MSRHRMPAGGAGKPDEATDSGEDVAPEAVELTASSAEGESTAETSAAAAESTESTETSETSETSETAGDADAGTETPDETVEVAASGEKKGRINWSRVLAYGLLPGIALVLVLAAGYAKWQYNDDRTTDVNDPKSAAAEAMETAKNSTIAMLSYEPDTVDKQLNDARDLLTGEFRDEYTTLINDVVIPGAQQKKINAVVSVPGVAMVSAEPKRVVALVFVNQTVVVDGSAPTDTASSVRVTLDKIGDRWLISKFEPV